MNELAELKQKTRLTYANLANAIQNKTGRAYSPDYLCNVARGVVPISDALRWNLSQAFPDFYLPTGTQNSVSIHRLLDRPS